jgi:hypothetical protein
MVILFSCEKDQMEIFKSEQISILKLLIETKIYCKFKSISFIIYG